MTLSLAKSKLNHQTAYKVALLVMCLMAFGLRLHLLEDVILTDDEEVSQVLYVQQPARYILTDYHPNNHWLMSVLGHLMGQLGPQRFLLRWPAVFLGTLAVPLIALTGYRLFKNWRDALIAALLLSISAFHIQWSQQFRGYSALLFFALLAFLELHQALQTGHRRYWVGFLAALVLAIASHLYGVLMLIVTVVILVSWSWLDSKIKTQRTSILITCAIACVTVAYFIWFGKTQIINIHHSPPQATLPQLIRYQVRAFGPTLPQVDDFLKETAVAFTAHHNELFALILFWGLGLAGTALSFRRFPHRSLWLAVWLILPIVVVIIAEFAIAGFFVYDRYLIFTLPAWILLTTTSLTAGSSWLASRLLPTRRYRVALVSLLLISSLSYLVLRNFEKTQHYFADRAGNDWRGVAAYLAGQVAEHDLIICKQLPHRWPPPRLDLGDPCTEELRRRLSELNLSPEFPIRQLEIIAAPSTGLQFRPQAQRPGAVWIVLWGQKMPLSFSPTRDDRLYASARPETETPSPHLKVIPQAIAFDRLGYTTVLRVNTEPTLVANLAETLSYLARLDNDSLDRFDYDLRRAYILAYQGRLPEAQAALRIAQSLPGYQPEALAEAGHILEILANFNRPVNPPIRSLQADFGNPPHIRLIGYSFPADFQAGQPILLVTFWEALRPAPADYTVFLHLLNASQQILAQSDFQPFDGIYPTSHWSPGAPIKVTHAWTVPPELSPGWYTLHLGLYQAQTLIRLPLEGDKTGTNALLLGKIRIEESGRLHISYAQR